MGGVDGYDLVRFQADGFTERDRLVYRRPAPVIRGGKIII